MTVHTPRQRARPDPTQGARRRTLAVRGGTEGLRTAADGVVAHVAHVLGPSCPREDAVLAVHEVLANALEHGHLSDPGIPIVVEVESAVTRARVRITDRARGGVWTGPRTDGAAAASATRGRGWRLVEQGCDRAEVAAPTCGRQRTTVELTWRA